MKSSFHMKARNVPYKNHAKNHRKNNDSEFSFLFFFFSVLKVLIIVGKGERGAI